MSASVSSPVLPPPTPRRPAGVVVAAVVLALMAAMVLLDGGMMVLAAFAMPLPSAHSGAVKAVLAGIGAGSLLFAGFCAWTVVDLFRMKQWARISITVLGVLLALFSALLSLLYFALAFSTTTYLHRHPGISYIELKGVLIAFGVFFVGMVLVGVWWLVYFSLGRTRRSFAASGTEAALELMAEEPVDLVERANGVVGILVNCLAVLYLISVLFEAGTALLGYPPMFFGHLFMGRIGDAVWVSIGLISIGIGIGLIRRVKGGWVAAVVFTLLGAVSQAMLMTAYGQEQMLDYQQRFGHGTAMNQPMVTAMMHIGAIGGILMMAAVLWLLVKARPLFESKK